MPSKTAHKRGWKDIQTKKQANKKTKWALIILAAVCGLLILGNTIKFVRAIFAPWQQVAAKKFLWQGQFNINFLIKAKNVSLVTFSPQNQEITILDIPANSYLEVPFGFGKWEIRSVFELGKGQKEIGGDKLLKSTVTDFLGLPIDGFLHLKGKYSQFETASFIDQFRKDPFIILNLLPYLKTDLSPFELIRLKMGLSAVRFDKVKQIDLYKVGVFEEIKLADGTEVLAPDPVKIDSITSQLTENLFQSEHKTIAIFNATNHPLLAQKAARLIGNIGGNVIITANGQKKYAKTMVLGEKSQTLERLKQIFGTDGTIDPENKDLVSSRAQINIFLGEDYYK